MQELNEKTRLKSKNTQNKGADPQFFYPPYGWAGIANAFSFYTNAPKNEKSQAKNPSEEDEESLDISLNTCQS